MKSKFTKLATALAAVIGFSVLSSTAQATNIAGDGIGELLYIPYYTVKNGQNTHIRLVNTSNLTVAVKLIAREGAKSNEVRDFHIILSPRDVWTGYVTAEGTNSAKIVTTDNSCTVPDKGNGWTPEATGGFSVSFDTTRGANQEGYLVALVMGVQADHIPGTDIVGSVPYLAKHVNGVPRNCGAIDWGFTNALDQIKTQFKEPMNVLTGSSSLVSISTAGAANVPVTILANTSNPNVNRLDGIAQANLIQTSSAEIPNELSLDDYVEVYQGVNTNLYAATFNEAGAVAVSAALMRSSVINSFDSTSGGSTNWVVTFPTKKFHVENKVTRPPFPANNAEPAIQPLVTDNEELSFTTLSAFSPAALTPPTTLPNEVNVLTFGTNVLGSSLAIAMNTLGIQRGWAELTFNNSTDRTGTDLSPAFGDGDDDANVIFRGLPVIGFSLTTTQSGVATSYVHSYRRNIQ